MACDYLAWKGYELLLGTLENARRIKPELDIVGILPTMYQNTNHSKEVLILMIKMKLLLQLITIIVIVTILVPILLIILILLYLKKRLNTLILKRRGHIGLILNCLKYLKKNTLKRNMIGRKLLKIYCENFYRIMVKYS